MPEDTSNMTGKAQDTRYIYNEETLSLVFCRICHMECIYIMKKLSLWYLGSLDMCHMPDARHQSNNRHLYNSGCRVYYQTGV